MRRAASALPVHGVTVDPSAHVARDVRWDLDGSCTVRIGPGVVVGPRCRFVLRGASVEIGEGTVLGDGVTFLGQERIVIGARCRLGDEAVLIDFGHRTDDVEVPVRLQGLAARPIVVEDDVVLREAAAVLQGVRVGAGASVGVRAVVTRDVPPGVHVEGIPARVPGRRPA